MIVKSLSRKKPSFKTLIEYIDKGSIKDNSLVIWKNIYNSFNKDELIKEFMANSSNLKSIKNWNYLYHEIISLDPNQIKDIPQDEQIKILWDIWEKYLDLRASYNLSYWKIHLDKEHIHLHLCISANELHSNKRLRYSKYEFNKIQQDLEQYKNEKYPQLQTNIYNRWYENDNLKLTKDEQELINRTKKPTLKGIFKDKLQTILDSSLSYKELTQSLKTANIEIIKRWNTITAKDLTNNKKYRLKTLWLLKNLDNLKKRIEVIKSRTNDIENFKKEKLEKSKNNLKINTNTMNSIQAKKIQIKDLLANLWCNPTSVKWDDIWYISPFRDEKTSSFKIDTTHNIWYDHWMGKWWNILDFVMEYNRCDFKGALEFLSSNIQPNLFNPPKISHIPQEIKTTTKSDNQLTITKTKPLENMALIDYMKKRVINTDVAKRYVFETYYKVNNKSYFWVSLKNDSGWLELNNKYFKWISWTKDITTIDNNSDELVIFEGMMDFLSYASVSKKVDFKNIIILNSVAMIKKAIKHITNNHYRKIESFLDNDIAWVDATNKLKEYLANRIKAKDVVYKNKSNLFKKHKDFNDYIIARRDKKLQDLELQKEDRVIERVRQRD